MITQEVANELATRGYDARVSQVVKNGIQIEAISIMVPGTKYGPAIYLDTEQTDVKTEADRVENIYNSVKDKELDTTLFTDPWQAKQGLRIGLQRQGSEDLVKRNSTYEGLEEYLYIVHGDMTAKVRDGLLETIELTEEEAWKVAEENTEANYKIFEISEFLGELASPELVENNGKMYVLTNTEGVKGAGVATSKKALKEVAEMAGTNNLILLPSSIHEFLIIPADTLPLEHASEMVKQVNETIDPTEVLIDRAYRV